RRLCRGGGRGRCGGRPPGRRAAAPALRDRRLRGVGRRPPMRWRDRRVRGALPAMSLQSDFARAERAALVTVVAGAPHARLLVRPDQTVDRKSTRLNSSHDQISYAVFCLKKKKSTTRACNTKTTTDL